MIPIGQRRRNPRTHAFVAVDTVDALAEKMVGIIADRRCTLMNRFLGERAGIPLLVTGLRLWRGGFSNPILRRLSESVYVSLANTAQQHKGVGFHAAHDRALEAGVAARYHELEKNWLGQRRDITVVTLTGCPGQLARTDSIRIEWWNDDGLGHETILVFDDVDPVQELAWDLKHDPLRQVDLDDRVCITHGLHYEDPTHRQERGCVWRDATLAENLTVLATLAQHNADADDAGRDAEEQEQREAFEENLRPQFDEHGNER